VPSVHPECYFPADQRGRWLLFDSERHEEVVVDPGHVTFSQLGSFICKSKHWRKDQYKTLSVYANGWSVPVSIRNEAYSSSYHHLRPLLHLCIIKTSVLLSCQVL